MRGSRMTHRRAALGICLAAVAAPMVVVNAAGAAASSQLLRYPYLTDVTANSVRITFDTQYKIVSATGAVKWGTPSGSTGCNLTAQSASSTNNSVNAPITVAGVREYATSILVTGLSAGTQYCYRVFTGGATATDLLGSDVAPRFKTLPSGSSVTFDVFGDWGDNTVAGGLNQQRVDALIAQSGAQFAVSTGDIAYPDGSQTNYGNLRATGTAVSQVFGAPYWKRPGASIPLFSTAGNHGRSSTFLQNWRQATTVAASGGKYVMEAYSGQDGTTPSTYPSVWYAFTAGNARFYILDADWSDTNVGTAAGGLYQVDRDYHWQATSPEYKWLKADLASHTNTLKFAFFHFPLRSDNATQPSDTFLQNNPNTPRSLASLEGLLANSGVNLAFNGHAHIYQRNIAPPGAVTSYVTGGGGGKVAPVGHCAPSDAYAVGWSYTNAAGSRCGSAVVPSSDAQIYHFLKVSVSGSTVTVTPTNSAGSTFDVHTYSFAPDTTAPVAPSGLKATRSGSAAQLSWAGSVSTDVSGQDIYRNGLWLATIIPTARSFTDPASASGSTYTIRAHDLRGNQSPNGPATGPLS